jgi:hypothetical protein
MTEISSSPKRHRASNSATVSVDDLAAVVGRLSVGGSSDEVVCLTCKNIAPTLSVR